MSFSKAESQFLQHGRQSPRRLSIDFPPVLPARPHTRFHGRIRQMRTFISPPVQPRQCSIVSLQLCSCLLYTSDAADEL